MALKYQFKTKPYSHQLKALGRIRDLNGVCALLMEMGTGKTKVAIDWCGVGFRNFEFQRVLVVCPLSVVSVWFEQLERHCAVPYKAYNLTGKVKERIQIVKELEADPSRLTFLVINYEGIWRTQGKDSMEVLLQEWKPDVSIFDESHRIKRSTTRQSKAAWRIGRASRNRLILTGTPITKNPLDIFGQFRALHPGIFGENWYRFKNHFAIWGGFQRFQVMQYIHLDELTKGVRENSYRVKKAQCLDLPEKVYVTVPVVLPDSIRAQYKELAKEAILELENSTVTAPIVLVKLLRLSQLTSGFLKDTEGHEHIVHDKKLNTCIDLMEDMLEEDHKIVVFARFLRDINRVSLGCTAHGWPHAILSGSVPQADRDSLLKRFHSDPEQRILIAQIQTGSLGIDLTPADVAIFYSLSYDAAHYWQAQDRLHRIGQDKKVTYYHLIAERTIDSTVLKVLQRKEDLAKIILENKKLIFGMEAQ